MRSAALIPSVLKTNISVQHKRCLLPQSNLPCEEQRLVADEVDAALSIARTPRNEKKRGSIKRH